MVAHNAEFDTDSSQELRALGLPFDFTIARHVALARILLPQLNRFKLDTVAKAVVYRWITITGRSMTRHVRRRFL